MENKSIQSDILVVGAGISGISTALEAAETGYSVTLIEKRPYIGGRVAQLNQYFPKLCPPSCGLEINVRRIKENPNIKLLTLAEVKSIEGEAGNYNVKTKVKPRYVREEATEFQLENAAQDMTVERSNEYNYGMDKTKVLYMPYSNCYPQKYVFEKEACTPEQLDTIKNTYGDVLDLDQQEVMYDVEAKAIVWAAGWEPYNADKLETLGYKEYPEVVTNVEMERLAAPNGPTEGKIVIPGSDKEIKKVAFVQCAGSRDETHLEYCSSVCCLASMKQARYIRKQYPEAEIHIFYIDLRSYGIFEDFYNDTQEDEKIHWHRGKVAKVLKDDKGRMIVEAEDTLVGELNQAAVDMVVLATGMKPASTNIPGMNGNLVDRNGFIRTDKADGIIGCGVCARPIDVAGCVRESTAAAIKAIHTIKGAK